MDDVIPGRFHSRNTSAPFYRLSQLIHSSSAAPSPSSQDRRSIAVSLGPPLHRRLLRTAAPSPSPQDRRSIVLREKCVCEVSGDISCLLMIQ